MYQGTIRHDISSQDLTPKERGSRQPEDASFFGASAAAAAAASSNGTTCGDPFPFLFLISDLAVDVYGPVLASTSQAIQYDAHTHTHPLGARWTAWGRRLLMPSPSPLSPGGQTQGLGRELCARTTHGKGCCCDKMHSMPPSTLFSP